MYRKAEFLDHHEAGKNDEDLPPGTGHELQGIIQPIAPPQDHPLDLRVRGFELRIGNQADEGDGGGYSFIETLIK
jgi:hypothetical protein